VWGNKNTPIWVQTKINAHIFYGRLDAAGNEVGVIWVEVLRISKILSKELKGQPVAGPVSISSALLFRLMFRLMG